MQQIYPIIPPPAKPAVWKQYNESLLVLLDTLYESYENQYSSSIGSPNKICNWLHGCHDRPHQSLASQQCSYSQTYQVSRIGRESHSLAGNLTFSCLSLYFSLFQFNSHIFLTPKNLVISSLMLNCLFLVLANLVISVLTLYRLFLTPEKLNLSCFFVYIAKNYYLSLVQIADRFVV